MNRRSFLGLLAGAMASPVLARLAPSVEPAVAREALADIDGSLLRVERYVLGFSQAWCPAGRVALISARPQRAFLPLRLIVAPGGELFDILNLSASGEPQLDEAVPTEFFSAFAEPVPLPFSPVPPGDEIVMAVHNRGPKDANFTAALIGRSA